MSKGKVIVTGGAGYIGSHAVMALLEQGWSPVIIDNFIRGSHSVASKLSVPLYEGDIGDQKFLSEVFTKERPVVVMHFAALAYVGESVTDPAVYYTNNVAKALSLLQVMRDSGVDKIIFSSTCATYGQVAEMPITEETPQKPINPYGHSKLMVEQILNDYATAYGFNFLAFRYFNAAGAHASGLIGEMHNPETHLLPLAIAAAQGQGKLSIFGSDYPTSDGTCIRDFIHVSDIAEAHVLGIDYLSSGKSSRFFNLGNGRGYSVMEVVKAVENISGRQVPLEIKDRRPGDPPILVANASQAYRSLGWTPRYSSLEQIVETAWKWHRRL